MPKLKPRHIILLLLKAIVVSSFEEKTVIVSHNSSSNAITVEWTKTEKISISIPLNAKHKSVEEIDPETSTTTTTSASDGDVTDGINYTEGPTTDEMNITSRRPTPDRPCGGQVDVFILLDAAAMKYREQTAQLVIGFFEIVNAYEHTFNCNRFALLSYSKGTQILIPLKRSNRVGKEEILEALNKIEYTDDNWLVDAIGFIESVVLRGRSREEFMPIVVVLAVAEAVSSESEKSDTSLETMQNNIASYRADITEIYDARILLVVSGDQKFPMLEYLVPDEEMVKIESFQNLSMQPLNEFCCRFSMCAGMDPHFNYTLPESNICKRVKDKEQARRTVYPKCDGLTKGKTDFSIVLDRAALKHAAETVDLTQGLIRLIDPWNTNNRFNLISYGNGSMFHIRMATHMTMENVTDIISSIDPEDGSDFSSGLWLTQEDFGDWRDQSRQRVVVIIASSGWDSDVSNVVKARARIVGQYGAKIFLVTIGQLPMDVLKFVVPEKEMVNIESFENFSITKPIDEFKRRFCL